MFVVMEAAFESLDIVSRRSKRGTAGRHGGKSNYIAKNLDERSLMMNELSEAERFRVSLTLSCSLIR